MNLDQIKEIESLKEQVAQLELIRDEHDERGIDIGILVQNLNSVETKLTSLQSKSAELKEQVAQWETEYNGCSALLNNAERTIETLEETIAQQAEAIRLKDAALEKIACIGNGDTHGNSIGNCLAIDALAIQPSPEILQARDEKVAEACAKAVIAYNGQCDAHVLASQLICGEWRKYV